MDIDEYIQFECERQSTTKTKEMRKAFDLAASLEPKRVSLSPFVQSLAAHCEPTVNKYRNHGSGVTNLRRSNVGFMNAGKATQGVEVREQFNRLVSVWDWEFIPGEVYVWIKSFLDIHPFLDGNGRVASILQNWMLDTIDDPIPLPKYRF